MNPKLGTGIYFNGQQMSTGNDDQGKVLFNFADASTLSINGQIDGTILAPYAVFTSTSQVGGTVIAASISKTGEMENIEFDGALPQIDIYPEGTGSTQSVVPEPGTLWLLTSGLLVVMFLIGRDLRRRRRKNSA